MSVLLGGSAWWVCFVATGLSLADLQLWGIGRFAGFWDWWVCCDIAYLWLCGFWC